MTLQITLDSLIAKLETVTGISYVPSAPVDQLTQDINGVVYVSGMNWKSSPAPSYRAYYDITIQIGMVRGQLHQSYPILMPFADSVPTALEAWICAEKQNIENKTATFGNYTWGGVDYLGWIFQIDNVKDMVTP